MYPKHFHKKESDLSWSDITRTLVSVMVGNANTDLTASVQLCTRGSGRNNFQRKLQLLKLDLEWDRSDTVSPKEKWKSNSSVVRNCRWSQSYELQAAEARAISYKLQKLLLEPELLEPEILKPELQATCCDNIIICNSGFPALKTHLECFKSQDEQEFQEKEEETDSKPRKKTFSEKKKRNKYWSQFV